MAHTLTNEAKIMRSAYDFVRPTLYARMEEGIGDARGETPVTITGLSDEERDHLDAICYEVELSFENADKY